MGYDLKPRNKELDWFHFGAFSWPVLQQACSYLFPEIHSWGRWVLLGVEGDPRWEGKTYPPMGANDGHYVTAEEARTMATIASNYADVQRSKDDILEALKETRIRDDFIDKFEKFADWGFKSQGFWIW